MKDITSNKNHSNSNSEKFNELNELENVVEKYTRTERHLEQHSDIANAESIDQAKEKQKEREEQIKTLENKIVNGESSSKKAEIENVEKNIKYGEGYLNHNSENMNQRDLENLKDKQENRKDTLNSLQ
ncbi:hypothetical protein CPAST_c32830 [Clostridium pasteurianum DSM 525 = ATCC 6013]|uniref:Uncharacterized protein n=1 Tax=Clostridium pasteurianum DSM 525 = ATCC 6013 TaxID=1262449 RepID=A0A0H3J797_CLOPA|nr:hypothetical protein [Clostridium pasteurianum]AJA49349.1 hypothetical protein CPAST_c32830 [Clostridium pasteurianum DSM 525 = ATCC 6013]AJA53337.1 hypothetical protein CLPA_c32830 [Clostridium pasteurianum DSM 525 = ATCC 6013]AOZ76523.1 hypothetical protein AQ983_15945 [Clostridium pasteurianum DSM 525 = ATCC 6013]AOZ80320.1 hypothetical protein AQ984_15940 [Clostridium pasteurianum]ELP58369.1 hypothetical protein F502_15420 [Clostridium pasteurianum DSM 525 = ATCC 6013]